MSTETKGGGCSDRGSDSSAPRGPTGVMAAAVQRWPTLKCSSVSSVAAHHVTSCGRPKASRQPAEPDRATQASSRHGSSGVAEVAASAHRPGPDSSRTDDAFSTFLEIFTPFVLLIVSFSRLEIVTKKNKKTKTFEGER